MPTTAAGDRLDRVGDRAVRGDERAERRLAVVFRIDVDDGEPGREPGADADVRIGRHGPPLPDDRGVGRRAVQAEWREPRDRVLAGRSARGVAAAAQPVANRVQREHGPAARCVGKRGIKYRGHRPLPVRAAAIAGHGCEARRNSARRTAVSNPAG